MLQAFELAKNVDGEVVVRFKHRPSHKLWCGMRRGVVSETGERGIAMNPREPPFKLFHSHNGRRYPDLTALPPLKHKAVLPEEIVKLRQHVTANTPHLQRVFGVDASAVVNALEEDIRALEHDSVEEFECPWDTDIYSSTDDAAYYEDSGSDASDVEEELAEVIETSISRSRHAKLTALNDARYDVGNYVAIVAPEDAAAHFWVGRIERRPYESRRPKDILLEVLWYEPMPNKKYNTALQACKAMVDGEMQPNIDTVSIHTIITQFQPVVGLRGSIKVPPSVYKQLSDGGALDTPCDDTQDT